MKYHALFVIFEKAAKFEMVVFCKLKVALYGLIQSSHMFYTCCDATIVLSVFVFLPFMLRPLDKSVQYTYCNVFFSRFLNQNKNHLDETI